MWNEARLNNPEQTQIILAYTRVDAKELNALAREQRKSLGELGEDHKIETAKGERQFARGERVYFLQNDRTLGVKNGTLGTLTDIQGTKLSIRLDKDMSQQADKSAKTITIDTKLYNHIDHGYAATIHKAQGVTVDRSYVLASKYIDSHATYVAMSRHRESAELFYSREEFANQENLTRTLGRERTKDVTLDYPYKETAFARHRGVYNTQPREVAPSLKQNPEFNTKRLAVEQHHESLEEFKARYQQKHPEMSNLHQRVTAPKDDIKSFMAQFEAKNPQLAKKLSVDIMPQHEKRALLALHEIQQLYKQEQNTPYKHLVREKLEKYAEKIDKDNEVMAYMKKHDEKIYKEIQELSRSRGRDYER